MYVVALTRFGQGCSAETEAPALAPELGLGAYEAKLLLAGTPPLVLRETDDVELAKRLLGLLRGRGHGAVACDRASVTASSDMFVARDFSFEPDALVAGASGHAERRMPYSEIVALLEALHVRGHESTTERKEKKFDLGRAALSGGLVLSKSKTITERETKEERERVLYVMNRAGSGHVLLVETRLRYTALGPRLGKSSAENFATTVALLREHAPRAFYDDRLLRFRKAGAGLRTSGTGAARTIATSNDAEVDLAAHLVTVAFLQAQV